MTKDLRHCGVTHPSGVICLSDRDHCKTEAVNHVGRVPCYGNSKGTAAAWSCGRKGEDTTKLEVLLGKQSIWCEVNWLPGEFTEFQKQLGILQNTGKPLSHYRELFKTTYTRVVMQVAEPRGGVYAGAQAVRKAIGDDDRAAEVMQTLRARLGDVLGVAQ